MEWIALSKSNYIPNHCQTHIFGEVQLTLLPSGYIIAAFKESNFYSFYILLKSISQGT